ncbi:MAG: DUF4476 domain-containing protein [Flavobacteriales bacterium]|nr:DUF4476 domain-containing protein [Flavobacteriales bacterium]
MKKIYALFVACFSVATVFAQTSAATIFSENGEKFIIYLNGEQKNKAFQSNVSIEGLTGEFYQLRVDFEDATLRDFSDNSFGLQTGMHNNYMIKLNKKGEFVCRWQSASPLNSTPAVAQTSQPDAQTRSYATADDAVAEPAAKPVKEESAVATGAMGTDVKVTQTTTTTTNPGTTSGERVSMNMNVGGVNMGVDFKVEGDATMMETEESHTTVTQTTTTRTSGDVKPAAQPVAVREEVVVGPCSSSMSPTAFKEAKTTVESKPFDETRLSIAKTLTSANCLTAAQIRDLCGAFSFEETKLDFAKYAYDYCFDTSNYFMVSEAFTFDSSVEELNAYIQSK